MLLRYSLRLSEGEILKTTNKILFCKGINLRIDEEFRIIGARCYDIVFSILTIYLVDNLLFNNVYERASPLPVFDYVL